MEASIIRREVGVKNQVELGRGFKVCPHLKISLEEAMRLVCEPEGWGKECYQHWFRARLSDDPSCACILFMQRRSRRH